MTVAVERAGEVLRLIRTGRASTVSTLAAELGMARSTVGQRLDALEGAGLVVSGPASPGQRGRPAAAWRFDPHAATVFAAHLGMTGSRAVLADLDGEILGEEFVPVDMSAGLDTAVEALGDAFERMRTSAPALAIGVGLPSALEYAGYRRSLGLDGEAWTAEGIHDRLRARFAVPVVRGLDIALLAQAERARSWPDAEVVVGVKIGTLVGASVVVDGVAVRGARGAAGEFGHVRVPGRDDPCTCGGAGCVDAVASGSAVVRTLAGRGHAVERVADVVSLVRRGDPDAASAVRDAGRDIGAALASVVNLLNPAVICSWGYLVDADAHLLAGIREGLYQNALPSASDGLPIVRAAGGDVAGARGAADMAIAAVLESSAIERIARTGSLRA